MSDRIQATGRCLCGNIRFQVQGDPIWIAHCHCQSCRRNTGSAVATFIGYHPERVIYEVDNRQFYESSPGVRRGFCGKCGTPMSYEADKYPDELHLYVSTMDEPNQFVPEYHVFHAEHIPWFEVADDLPRYDGTSS